ncbi:MAG: hypothetical protein ABIH42_08895 [Planctomycetota bacterium]
MIKFKEKIKNLSTRRTFIYGLILSAVIEGITIFVRFGLGVEATRDTRWLSPYTFGIRDHHLYYGILLLLISVFVSDKFWKNSFFIIGISCFVSDLVHHFVVLWLITGSPQFDLTY